MIQPSAKATRPIDVHLRDTVSGDTRVSHEVGYFDEDGFSDFIWSDGNFACDCNRSLMLWPDQPDKAMSCSNKNQIVIDRIIDVDTGAVLYSEAAEAR